MRILLLLSLVATNLTTRVSISTSHTATPRIKEMITSCTESALRVVTGPVPPSSLPTYGPWRAPSAALPSFTLAPTITFASWGVTMQFQLACVRMVRVIALAVSLALAQALGRGALAQSPIRLLDQVVLEVIGVEDSSQYLVYRYRVLNSASSRSGVAGINLD